MIFDTSKCYIDQIPLHYDVLTEVIHNACSVARDVNAITYISYGHINTFIVCSQIIMNDWLPRVADLIDVMRKFWEDLVPRFSSSPGLGETFFKCIHALMSCQLRGLIQRSINHLFNTIKVYGVR